MAKNDPNKPDEAKTAPAQETTAEEKSTPAPMPGNKCILQLRGLRPFLSPKYDLKQQ